MIEHSSWKRTEWSELAVAVDGWSAESWSWQLGAVSNALNELDWYQRKTARDMVLFNTTLSPETEAVLRLDNSDKSLIRSVALAATTVVTAHESNTTKAKTFLADAFSKTATSLETALGGAVKSNESEAQWDVIAGHIVLGLTKRSVRLTFYSPAGLEQAELASKSKAEMAGREKTKKAPAPWRV